MSQSAELERVKDRIRKMSVRTVDNGCSEAEALQAMEMVGQLLEQYNLSMDEVDIREEKCIQMLFDTGIKKSSPITKVAVAVAEYCTLRVWTDNFRKGSGQTMKVALFGQESDVLMADYLLKLIHEAMKTESAKFVAKLPSTMLKGARRTRKCNFEEGFVIKINQRLRKMKVEMEAHLAAQRVTGTALVVVKQQVVEEEFSKMGMKLRARYQTYKPKQVPEAKMAGYEAGDTVNLSRPIDGAGPNKLIGGK
jgi:DNA primase large subunit